MAVLNYKFGVLLGCFTTTIVAAVTTVYFFRKLKEQKPPCDWIKVGNVTKLCLYPLESGRATFLEKAECSQLGLEEASENTKLIQLKDRDFVVYGPEDEEFRTAKVYPHIVLISIRTENELVVISAPEMSDLKFVLPTSRDNETLFVKCRYEEPIYGIDCGSEVASWVSKYLIKRTSGLRLAYNDDGRARDFSKYRKKQIDYYKNPNNDGAGLFSSTSSLMLVNQKSIDEMNGRIGNSNATSDNFRPNIVIDGDELEAYAEDNWDWIRVGNRLVVRNVEECPRCIITTINPEDGVPSTTREPLKTLETYRMSAGPKKAPVMGINLGVATTGQIRVGDPVYVTIKKQLGT